MKLLDTVYRVLCRYSVPSVICRTPLFVPMVLDMALSFRARVMTDALDALPVGTLVLPLILKYACVL